MKPISDLTGKRFGKLRVIKKMGVNKYRASQWLCKCDCGEQCIKLISHLNAGYIKSCGCLKNLNENEYLKILKQRLFDKRKIIANGCWEWQGALAQGYGLLHIRKGNHKKAHRLSWEIFKGPIPKDLCVCHHCDNRKCFNPDHLFLGTQKMNMKDMSEKGRRKGIKPKRRKL